MYERLGDFSSTRSVQAGIPVQNEDYFEWIDLLESVVTSAERFRMIELGAGWGKWLTNGACAARQRGLGYIVVGVEAEPTHFAWMRRHPIDNDIDPSKTQLHNAAVARAEREVRFHVGDPADWYGQKIEPDAPAEPSPKRWRRVRRSRAAQPRRRLERLQAITLQSLLVEDEVVDLIDSDVQGAEAEVFEAAGDRLTDVVRRVHVGTHSDDNEERLRRLFTRLGWESLNDYPHGRSNETPYRAMLFEDGVQTWVNPRLS
jgi:FkbM family methyltransferase